MNNKERLYSISDEEFVFIVASVETKVDLHKKLSIPYNGTGTKLINTRIKETGAILKDKKYKWDRIKKICPVCGNEFNTLKGHKREKYTCSYGCSNTFFRSGDKHGNWKESSYRSTCFKYHEKKCVCCDETIIISVHHYDGDRSNNNPENLIPLCPTHHCYWHSNNRYMIEDKVNNYRNNFIRNNS
jgi:hypothetical protein